MYKNYIWEKLGNVIQNALNNEQVFEVILNPDGLLWLAHKQHGMVCAGSITQKDAEAFVHALAREENKFLNIKTPYMDAILPFNGERVNVTMPPITDRVSFNIRKKSKVIYSLSDYVKFTIMTAKQADVLKEAIRDRRNILVSGSPASGKTTLINALLDEMANIVPEGHRVLVLEQIPELMCRVKNSKSMLVSHYVSMQELLWLSMRNSPDRIVIGEVRDGMALDMLKAWNTGCPGGLATVHSNTARAAVQRVLDLSCEAVATPPYALAAESLDIIVHIEERSDHPAKRQVTELISVTGFDAKKHQFYFKSLTV